MSGPDTPRCPHCFEPTNATPCPHCGWQAGQDNPPPALALGRVLDGRYRVGRVLGHGGFGITYLAWDDNLHLRLAIKEYFPRDSAGRGADGVSLAVYSGPAGDQFAYGLERFLEEARTLAHFDQHPGIVTVKNFFRAHGTGYCVMDYVAGITLRQYLEQQPGGRISVPDALKLLTPVMDALRAVHKEGLLHRDLAPDNIYLTQDGRIKLLDFGAARYAASEHSKSLSIILKPGYAPEEQYRAKGKQGPWTDVYGLAATCYRAITGQVPPEALDRLDNDDLVPPSRLRGIAITPGQEATLLQALAVKAGQRFQDMAELQEAWRAGGAAAPPPFIDPNGPVRPRVEDTPTAKPLPWAKNALLLALVALLLIIATVALIHSPWPGTTAPPPPVAGGASSPLTPPTPEVSAATTTPEPIAATAAVPTASPATASTPKPAEPAVPLTPPAASSTAPTATPVTAAPSTAENSAGSSNARQGDAVEPPGDTSPNERYRFLGKDQDIVEDTRTKLQWQRCSLGQVWNDAACAGEATKYKWNEAQRVAPAGWRLPTKDELASLVYCSSGQPTYWKAAPQTCKGDYVAPTLWIAAFPNTPKSWFWSSSADAHYPNDAWSVGFSYGYVSYGYKGYGGYVRLVRGGIAPPDRATSTSDTPPPPPVQVNTPVPSPPSGEKVPLYFAAELAPTANIPPEAPLCYKFMVAGPEEQLQKLKTKYPGLYDAQVVTYPEGGQTLMAKRRDETGKEITYFYSTNPGICNAYQQAALSPPATATTGVAVTNSGETKTTHNAPNIDPRNGETDTSNRKRIGPNSRYVDNEDGTVTDVITGLMWMRCAIGQKWIEQTCKGKATEMNWDDAKKYNLNFAGYSDWRLPNIEELGTLVYCSNGIPDFYSNGRNASNDKNDWGCYGKPVQDHIRPTIAPGVFPNSPSSLFWSSTRKGPSDDPNGIYFGYGSVSNNNRTGFTHLRMVR
ncbi:MAG: DUF1566 domain-containing protein [Chromatiaceae bacterium]|nr:DUF1566 domain-containing protein [Chromatiaceae bacterium]